MNDIHNDQGMMAHGSRSSPIIVPARPDSIEWEYREMAEILGGTGKRLHQSLVMEGGKLLDRIVVDAPEQGRHVFYFDVTKNILDRGKMISAMEKAAPFFKKATEPGRNDPCSCGSGLKYKKCCANKGEAHGADRTS